ncbi:MAG: MAPEG family protein [Rhodomicrobium sp.]
MTQFAILLPACVLALWTLLVLTLVPLRRVTASLSGRTHVKDYRYGESANVPGEVSLPNRNYMNLLELPVLFYFVCLALMAAGRADQIYVWLAWAFVAARVLHSLVHIGYNDVMHRLFAFALGNLILAAMLIRLTASLV